MQSIGQGPEDPEKLMLMRIGCLCDLPEENPGHQVTFFETNSMSTQEYSLVLLKEDLRLLVCFPYVMSIVHLKKCWIIYSGTLTLGRWCSCPMRICFFCRGTSCHQFNIWKMSLQLCYYIHFWTSTPSSPLLPQLWVKLYQCYSSIMMTLAKNNPQMLICY